MKFAIPKLAVQGCLWTALLCSYSFAQPAPIGSSNSTPPKSEVPLEPQDGQVPSVSWHQPNCSAPIRYEEADLCEQRRQAKAAEDAVWWSRFQAIVAALGSVFLVWNLVYMRRTADIGAKANDLNKQAFITNQRAWLTTDLAIQDDFIWRPSNLGGGVSVKITNMGKTPALEAHTSISLILGQDVREQLKVLCRESKKVTESGRPVLPGESYDRYWYANIDAPEIAASLSGPKEKTVSPVLIGCVTYQILPDKTLHQTAFAYWISPHRGGFTLNTAYSKEELSVVVHTGGFAD